jgi:LmbE family N-acetylglucosaminyl deacetylase
VRQIYVSGHDEPNTWVDLTHTMDLKIAALRHHESQMGDWDPSEMIKEWATEAGQEKGLRYAESYKVVTLDRHEST